MKNFRFPTLRVSFYFSFNLTASWQLIHLNKKFAKIFLCFMKTSQKLCHDCLKYVYHQGKPSAPKCDIRTKTSTLLNVQRRYSLANYRRMNNFWHSVAHCSLGNSFFTNNAMYIESPEILVSGMQYCRIDLILVTMLSTFYLISLLEVSHQTTLPVSAWWAVNICEVKSVKI